MTNLNDADVLGLLTGIGREKDYERNGTKTKFNVIALEADGYCFWLNTCFSFMQFRLYPVHDFMTSL